MMTKEQMREIISEIRGQQAAKVFEAKDLTPFGVQKYSLTLTTAQSETSPLEIGFPFRCMWVKNGSTGSAYVNVKFNQNDSNISTLQMGVNDVIKTSSIFGKAFISWPAQSGVTIDIYFFVDHEVMTGSLINSGTVTVAVPNAFTVTNPVISAASATSLFALSTSAKSRTIQNNSGASIWVGGSGVTNSGATRGVEVINGATFSDNTQAALYCYSVAGGAAGVVTCVEES